MNLKHARAGSAMALILSAASTLNVQQRKPQEKQILDSAVEDAGTFDAVSVYTDADIKLKSVAAIQEWLNTETLEDGETSADRLMALFVGIADSNKDGELTDDEQDVVNLSLNAAFEYFVSKGVDESDAESLLSDWAPDVADRIRELLVSGMPDGEDAESEEIDNFAFGEGDQEAVLDAVYQKRMVVRAGKKIRINKRISGHIRLSARQKVAIAKMQRRSHSGAAMARRAKSMRLRSGMGL
jgi:hypothetical protein